MPRRKHIKPEQRVEFAFSPRERDLILERTFLDPEIETRLRVARLSGTKLAVPLTLDDIDDLAGCIAAEANHTTEPAIRRALDALHDRLTALENRFTDAPTSVPQPAPVVNIAASKFTAKQGQYLAFVHYYTKIHGVSPAEADLQRYFRVSPPAVQHTSFVTATVGMNRRTGPL